MVRETFPEVQSLVSTNAEKRRSTRIPLDNKNSRILRQSITNYQGQSASIQDEIVSLEQTIEQLRTYTTAVPASLPVEDEQMHGIEKYMKSIGCSACKVRSMLKHLEPKSESTTSVECSQSTIQRRGSYYNTKYTQYHTLAVTVHTVLAFYKGSIDDYYSKLVSNSQHRPMSYWVVAEDEDDLAVETPLIGDDLASNVLKVKQKLSLQEHEVTEREKRIREWHKLLSSTFHSKLESDDDTSSSSSPPSYDIEAGLVKVHEYNAVDSSKSHGKKRRISAKTVGLSVLLVTIIVIVLLGVAAVVLYYHGGFETLYTHNVTSAGDESTQDVKTTTIQVTQAKVNTPILKNTLTSKTLTMPTPTQTITSTMRSTILSPSMTSHPGLSTTRKKLDRLTTLSTTSTETVQSSTTSYVSTSTASTTEAVEMSNHIQSSPAPTNAKHNTSLTVESFTTAADLIKEPDNDRLTLDAVTTIKSNETTPTNVASAQNITADMTNVTMNDAISQGNHSEALVAVTTTPFTTVTHVLSTETSPAEIKPDSMKATTELLLKTENVTEPNAPTTTSSN